MRRPSKWGGRTEKTIDRLPSMLNLLEFLECCGGFIVHGFNVPAWGGGLLVMALLLGVRKEVTGAMAKC